MNETEMKNKGSVILIDADWKDHLRWTILNFDLVRRKMMCGNFALWIQVSSTAAKPSATRHNSFWTLHVKKVFEHQAVSQKEKLDCEVIGSGRKKTLLYSFWGFFPLAFPRR